MSGDKKEFRDKETFEEFLGRLDSNVTKIEHSAEARYRKIEHATAFDYIKKITKFGFWFIIMIPVYIIYLGARRDRK